MSSQKIGFWHLIPIVISSQIGGGTFIIPSALAKYGEIGLLSWIFTGCGAISLATMFGLLCSKYPLTGGPHIYISKVFGNTFGFFISWIYWIVSWLSTPTIIFTITATLKSVIALSNFESFLIEVGLLFIVTITNFFTIRSSSIKNAILTVMKMIPIMSVFCFGWKFCNFKNIEFSNVTNCVNDHGWLSLFSVLNSAALISMWGFIGVETATAPAESVNNTKTIIKSSVIGAIIVFLIYIVNNFLIYGILSKDVLQQSSSSYVDTLNIIYGLKNNIIAPLLIIPVCISSLNTWTIVSGQIAIGASKLKLLPAFLGKTNKYGSPYIAIIISSIGQLPFLILGKNKDISEKIIQAIDISGTVFLFVYLISTIVFLKVFGKKYLFIGIISMIFCIWTMIGAISYMYIILILMLTGLPLYIWMKKQEVNNV